MIGRDVRGSRNQPDEHGIGRSNAGRLQPKWAVTTAGDVSATPAVVVERLTTRDGDKDEDEDERDSDGDGDDDKGSGGRREVVFFPDWGGRFWKIDGDSGRVIWTRAVSEYNGITGSISRTSPAYGHGLVFIGDLNGNMMGIDAETGDRRWITELDPNPNAIVTASPVIRGRRLYIVTSSAGGGPARAIFRGSLVALDALTGRIEWQTFVLPDNGGVPGGFAGGAFVNSPTIDPEAGLVYAAAGQLYNQPASVTSCLAAAHGGWDEACFLATRSSTR